MTKILVIEDEDDIRDILCEILSAEDFEVIAAEDGHIGVILAQEEIPDLIICDIMMPELDGYSVMSQLHQNPYTQAIPFIFLTAKASKNDLRLGMELGANDYLTKPFTKDELLGTVTTQLAKHVTIQKASLQTKEDQCDQLTRSLPDELHRPLDSILSLSSSLIEGYDVLGRENSLEILEEIHHCSESLYRLVQNILLYRELIRIAQDSKRVRILRGLGNSSPTKAPITEIVLRQARQFNRTADLELELQDVEVQIAQSKFRKIILEIINNALRYSPVNTPIRAQSLDQDKILELLITNHGRGMTPEQISDLGGYMQVEHSIFEHRCSGLGLVIAKLLTELHGGEFKVESIPNQQTMVRIILPKRE